MREGLSPPSPQSRPSGAAGAAPYPGRPSTGAQTDSSKPRRCGPSLKILCYETKHEKQAKETYKEIKRLLNDTHFVEMTDLGGTSANGASRADNHHYEAIPAERTDTLDSRSTARSSDIRGLISKV